MINQKASFRSSDGIVFDVDRRVLEGAAKGFPPSELEADGVVELPEDSGTLELFFRFTSPDDEELPDLDNLPFESVLLLAEAAEKYQASVLTYICRRRMGSFRFRGWEEDAKKYEQLISYATAHGYLSIVDGLLCEMLQVPLEEVARILPARYLVPWAQYLYSWKGLQVRFVSRACSTTWHNYKDNRTLSATARCVVTLASLSSFQDLNSKSQFKQIDKCPDGGNSCAGCKVTLDEWKDWVLAEIGKLPRFSVLAK